MMWIGIIFLMVCCNWGAVIILPGNAGNTVAASLDGHLFCDAISGQCWQHTVAASLYDIDKTDLPSMEQSVWTLFSMI